MTSNSWHHSYCSVSHCSPSAREALSGEIGLSHLQRRKSSRWCWIGGSYNISSWARNSSDGIKTTIYNQKQSEWHGFASPLNNEAICVLAIMKNGTNILFPYHPNWASWNCPIRSSCHKNVIKNCLLEWEQICRWLHGVWNPLQMPSSYTW